MQASRLILTLMTKYCVLNFTHNVCKLRDESWWHFLFHTDCKYYSYFLVYFFRFVYSMEKCSIKDTLCFTNNFIWKDIIQCENYLDIHDTHLFYCFTVLLCDMFLPIFEHIWTFKILNDCSLYYNPMLYTLFS